MKTEQSKTGTVIHEFAFETDVMGRLLYLDPQGLALLGYSAQNIADGLNAADLVTNVDRKRAVEYLERVLNGERIGLSYYTIVTKSGVPYSVLINGRPKEDRSGIIGTVFMPPPSSQIADLIWEHQQMFITVIEAIPCGLLMVNSEGLISHWNPTAEKITGMQRMDIIGKTCKEIFNCPNYERLCPVPQGRKGPFEPLCVNVTIKSRGRLIHLQKTSNYIHDVDGGIIGAIESFVDLSPQREAEAALNEARELVESARKAKRHFMANMNHEIRTPVNGIIGLLNLMLSENPTPTQSEYITCAKRSARNLMDLIDDILDFTIVDKGIADIEVTGFSLSSVIASVITRQYDLMQNQQVCIHSHVDDDVPDNILGDSGRLYQIIKHLVGNGIKFTPTGEVAVRVTRVPVNKAGLEEDQRKVVLHFSISDTGIGIPQEKLDLIFESMSQVDESSTRNFGGLGIGLNIVHRLVKLLEGRIWLESEHGRGTTVHFILPFRSASSGDDDFANQICAERTRTEDNETTSLVGTTCLIGNKDGALPGKKMSPLALAPAPLPVHWKERFETLKSLLDNAPNEAEALLKRLKAEAKAANQHPLERLLLRMLLALRREEKNSADHYYSILERKIRNLMSNKGHSANQSSEGESNENPDCRR